MPKPTCSACRREIAADAINVVTDVAYCRDCNISYKLSDLTHGGGLEERVDVSRPPKGAWFHRDGSGAVIGASHRSVGGAIGLLAISLFWNGIVSVFVLLATAGTLKHLGITAPDWFPAPKMDDGPMSLGMTLFLWVFLSPFILVGLGMIGGLLTCIAGRTEVRLASREGVVFTGVGPIGWRRRFDPALVKQVRVDTSQWRDSDGDRQKKTHILIEMQQGKTVKFGSGLTEERRFFVAGALRQSLASK